MKLRYSHLLLLLPLVFTSCKKISSVSDEELVSVDDKKLAGNVLEVDYFVNELEFIARSMRTTYPNQAGILSGSTITSGTTSEGKTKYDIVFNNTTGPDNKTRTGKLTVVYEDGIDNGNTVQGKHLHVRSDDEDNLYTVAGIKFKGSLVFTDIAAAKNSAAAPILHINAQSFLIKPNVEEIRFASSRKSKWIAGSSTADMNDDVLEITDQDYSIDVITSNNTSFIQATTETMVILNQGCTQSPFVSKKGSFKIEHRIGTRNFYLALGSGNCSDLPYAFLKKK